MQCIEDNRRLARMLEVPPVLKPAYWTALKTRPRCFEIERQDIPALPELVQKMADYCRERGGIGLAAPQVGIYKSLAILLSPKGKIQVMINPVITRWFGREIQEVEGCLSLPGGGQQKIWRSEKVEIACGTEEDPMARVKTEHTGLIARVIQHEIDHLNSDGEVFILDRMGPVAKSQMLRKYLKFRREQERAHV